MELGFRRLCATRVEQAGTGDVVAPGPGRDLPFLSLSFSLAGNKEGTSNWSVLMPAVSSRVAPRACCPRQWARVSWQWLCSPQLAPRDLGAAHLPLPPTVVGGPCLLPRLPTSISRLPPHHALSTPYPWKPGQHPNKELLGCVLEKKKKDSQE